MRNATSRGMAVIWQRIRRQMTAVANTAAKARAEGDAGALPPEPDIAARLSSGSTVIGKNGSPAEAPLALSNRA